MVLAKKKSSDKLHYTYKIQFSQSMVSFLLTLLNNNLFWCRHLFTNSNFLFNKFLLTKDWWCKTFLLIIIWSNFLPVYFLLFLQYSIYLLVMPYFKVQINFKSSVHFSYFLYLKSLVWFLNLSLNGVSEAPIYFLHSLLVLLETFASYTILGVRHLFSKGHSFRTL